MWQVWLVTAGIFFVVEMATVGFFIFWFGIGALAAMIVSIFAPTNIVLQGSIFLITSVILLLLTKPLINKFTKKDKKVLTNAYSIIGKTGIVTQDIKPTFSIGQIKVGSETWSAKSENNITIEKGTEIKVIKIDGVKAIVEPLKIESTNK